MIGQISKCSQSERRRLNKQGFDLLLRAFERMAGVLKETRSLSERFISSKQKEKPRETFEASLETRQVYLCDSKRFLAVFFSSLGGYFRAEICLSFENKALVFLVFLRSSSLNRSSVGSWTLLKKFWLIF